MQKRSTDSPLVIIFIIAFVGGVPGFLIFWNVLWSLPEIISSLFESLTQSAADASQHSGFSDYIVPAVILLLAALFIGMLVWLAIKDQNEGSRLKK